MADTESHSEVRNMQIQEALDQYLVQLEGDGRSHHTVHQARRHVRMLAVWVGATDIAAIKHEDVARFLASDIVRKRADGKPRKPSSGNSLRSSLRAFFAYAHASGLATTNAARLVRRATCAPARPRALSDSDCAKLMAALATATTPAEKRDRALFTVMLRCGVRVGSAVAVEIPDLDLASGEMRLRRMKNGDEDVVYVPDDVVPLLREHVGDHTTGPVFSARGGSRLSTRVVGKRLEAWAKRAGIEQRVYPHRLRHSFGMRVFARTGDVLVTARAMCHRSIASTAVYARPEAGRVRDAVAAP